MLAKTVKAVQKSIRLTPDIYEYIDNYYGENFSAKLSNLVYDARKGESKRKERFRELDNAIARKAELFDEISRKIFVIQQIGSRALHIERTLNTLYEEIKRLVTDERMPPGKSPPYKIE